MSSTSSTSSQENVTVVGALNTGNHYRPVTVSVLPQAFSQRCIGAHGLTNQPKQVGVNSPKPKLLFKVRVMTSGKKYETYVLRDISKEDIITPVKP